MYLPKFTRFVPGRHNWAGYVLPSYNLVKTPEVKKQVTFKEDARGLQEANTFPRAHTLLPPIDLNTFGK